MNDDKVSGPPWPWLASARVTVQGDRDGRGRGLGGRKRQRTVGGLPLDARPVAQFHDQRVSRHGTPMCATAASPQTRSTRSPSAGAAGLTCQGSAYVGVAVTVVKARTRATSRQGVVGDGTTISTTTGTTRPLAPCARVRASAKRPTVSSRMVRRGVPFWPYLQAGHERGGVVARGAPVQHVRGVDCGLQRDPAPAVENRSDRPCWHRST